MVSKAVQARIEFFKRPKTVKAILGGSDVIEVPRFDLILPATQMRRRGDKKRKDQALLIGRGVDIIPSGFYSHNNASKRGSFIELKTYGDEENMLKEWSPLQARIQASQDLFNHERLEGGERFFGWSWHDPEEVRHVVRPYAVLFGRIIDKYSQNSNDIQDKVEYVKTLTAEDSDLSSHTFRIPSRSGSKKEKLTLDHLTKKATDPRRFAEWPRFRTHKNQHECGFSYGRTTFVEDNIVDYCPHDVAAHVALSRKLAEDKKGIILQPFPMFTEPLLDVFMTLTYHTMIDAQGGDGRFRKRPLTFPEIDVLIMQAWLEYGNRETFYVATKSKQSQRGVAPRDIKTMSEYDWSRDGYDRKSFFG